MPPRGIAVPTEVRAELTGKVAELGREITELQQSLRAKPALLDLLPDVQIYHNAVRYALDDDIFYKTSDFKLARKFLEQGMERARDLRAGRAPWTNVTGLVVRGYVSKIDHSIQPYGLVVPATYHAGDPQKHRLDFWFHGRGNEMGEIAFINDRQTKTGEFAPADTFVLHPYGRYCNAYKFAGEVDVFEALENVERHYPIDTNRISVRGFSMGGAATWHIAAHHAGLWAAVNPGAGFVETPIYTKAFSKNPPPPWYEQKLWHLYDAVDYAGNLFNTRVIAYSGEIDPQKQAADAMAKAMSEEGLTLTHIIGPNTPHRYEPTAKKEVARLVDEAANTGRNPLPKEVNFETWTLHYNQMDWVTIDGLEKHWERARVHAMVIPRLLITLQTTNVSALSLNITKDLCSFEGRVGSQIALDGKPFQFGFGRFEKTIHFRKTGTNWALIRDVKEGGLQKRHALQGPIDDAFMDSFIMVRPTGQPMNEKINAWATNNLVEAARQWRLQFRGEPRVKDDTEITREDIESSNLILWGDPRSNKLFAKIASKLPIAWDAKGIHLGGKIYSADDHVPILIYPNPLNPKHYVVLNSGFTFADFAHLSNALQAPKLPDYAVIDITAPAATRVVDAGFFNEQWALP